MLIPWRILSLKVISLKLKVRLNIIRVMLSSPKFFPKITAK